MNGCLMEFCPGKAGSKWGKRSRNAFGGVLLLTAALLGLCACSAPEGRGADATPSQSVASPSPGIPDDEPAGTADTIQSQPDIPPSQLDLSQEPPLSDADLQIAVPDFLEEEQQDLYRRAHSLYMHLNGGDTTMIEYGETMEQPLPDWADYERVELNGMKYVVSQGRYANWADFDAVVHSIFTDECWEGLNPNQVYLEHNGRLCYIEAARGSGYYYNDNFPDEFELISRTENEVRFTLIGHYSPVWPREGETTAERNARLKKEYDYTLEFPIRLILTQDGWRFDEFHTALADEDEPVALK